MTALVLLVVAAPVCFYVAFSDLRSMRIPNWTVVMLFVLFAIFGPVLMPLPEYGWQLLHMPILLILGMVVNAVGLAGAGDAKFLAAAGPYLWVADLQVLIVIFAASLSAAYLSHRLAKYTALRALAPHWQSWSAGRKFPMGLPLAGTLVIYLALGAF
ncbi:prepilin peptidase [Lutimaribacter sp. EGI FJ00015]|uniref:Prepilin peptidase n=2 Tax=Lutimaribacter degradans TaxID=2945989 RepID=A0ACC5ZR81_9RHOB|nr:prepilin peptidase [Lutimaribacter sp. EGI FJ00013]MCM2560607.1 prepilin peptidase [Lutimaribacter sp. EGI FJ00013]MCO0612450.1 prepilin peptidase [Lutimaribacter sp. EGI FJ00015]MCO0634431.1 prepilin peptidase [Lutimaribacter sp. EGI FJ00014]